MRRIAALAFAIALLPTAAVVAAAPAKCGAPADLHDGWEISAPAAEGLDPAAICAIGPALEKMPGADPNGVVVARHGVLVYEHYFVGNDDLGPGLACVRRLVRRSLEHRAADVGGTRPVSFRAGAAP